MKTLVAQFPLGRILVTAWLLVLPADGADEKRHWPQWRGPLGTGVAPDTDPPVEWSETKNIRWRLALPGLGFSTPIIWGDRVFITTAVPYGAPLEPKWDRSPGAHDGLPVTHRQKFVVLAASRSEGKIIWQRTVGQALPHEGGHYTGSLASNSPVTDGQHLYAFFGSRGLYCLDLDGELQWKEDLGDMHTLHGHGEQLAGAPRRYADHQLGSRRPVLCDCFGQADWQTALEGRAQ